MNEKTLILPVLIPLLSGILMHLLPLRSKKVRNALILAAVLTNSLLIFALLLFPPRDTFTVLHFAGSYSLSLQADGAGKLFLALIALLWPPSTLYAFEYMEHEEHLPRFYGFYLMCYGATAGAALSANLLSMYVFYELLTLFSVPLIAHKEDMQSAAAARRFLIYSAAGTVLTLSGIGMLFTRAGCTPFLFGGSLSSAEGEPFLLTAYLLMFTGFGIKAGIFPFHAWLPAACVAPAPADALLDAVAVMNSAVFACIRCTHYVFGPVLLAGTPVQKAALAMTIITILFGSFTALREQQLEKRLAYSTISNISYILFGISLMTTGGLLAAFSHMIFHALMKLTLFSCAGTILCKTGREYASETPGLGRRMPLTFFTFTLAALALTGTPPLPGFLSKISLLTAAAETESAWATAGMAALVISAFFTAAYLLPLCVRAFFAVSQDTGLFTERDRDPGLPMLISFAVFSSAILILSFCSAPLTELLTRILPGA